MADGMDGLGLGGEGAEGAEIAAEAESQGGAVEVAGKAGQMSLDGGLVEGLEGIAGIGDKGAGGAAFAVGEQGMAA